MLEITPAARLRVESQVAHGIIHEPALRVRLAPRTEAESGRRYDVTLVELEDRERTEIAINVQDIRVFLDLDTSNLLSGGTLDWVTEEDDAGGFVVRTSRPELARASSPGHRALTSPLALRAIEVLDEEINPAIAAHGGEVRLVDVDEEESTLYVEMGGGCQGCAASQVTLRQGVERMIREQIPEVREVVDTTDHNAGANPYY